MELEDVTYRFFLVFRECMNYIYIFVILGKSLKSNAYLHAYLN